MSKLPLSCAGLVLAAALLAGSPAVSHAQFVPGGGAVRPQQNTALVEAKKRVAEAQAEVNRVKADQKKIKDKLRATFEEKEEWKQTVATHKKAKLAYETARKKAMAAAQAKPAYKALQADKEAARKTLEEVQAKRNPDPDEIAKVGTDLAKAGVALKNMEGDAMKSDEAALEAKEAYDKAKKELDALDDEVEDALASDPDYAQVETELEQAEMAMAQAKQSFTEMQRSEAQTRSAASKAAADARRSQRGSKSGSSR